MYFRQAVSSDVDAVRELLRERGLPASELHANLMGGFLVVVKHAEEIIGCIGVQRFGQAALVCCVAVSASTENGGLECLSLRTIERSCHMQGVSELRLPTTNAARFVEACGYALADKEAAPETMQSIEEFVSSSLCKRSVLEKSSRLAVTN